MAQFDRETVRKRALELVCEILEVGEEELLEGVALRDLETWDSLRHIEMVTEVEAAFEIQLTGDEIAEVESFQHLERALLAHLAGGVS